jgi:hypothetical protein
MYNPDLSYYELREERRNSHFINEMQNLKEKAVEEFSRVVHPKLAESMLKIVAWAYDNDDEEAHKIANAMHFGQKEMLAVSEDVKSFKELCFEEYQDRLMEQAYEQYNEG